MFKKFVSIALIVCAVFGCTFYEVWTILEDSFTKFGDAVHSVTGDFLPDAFKMNQPVVNQIGALGVTSKGVDLNYYFRLNYKIPDDAVIYPNTYRLVTYSSFGLKSNTKIICTYALRYDYDGHMYYISLDEGGIEYQGKYYNALETDGGFVTVFYSNYATDLTTDTDIDTRFKFVDGVEQAYTLLEWANNNLDG